MSRGGGLKLLGRGGISQGDPSKGPSSLRHRLEGQPGLGRGGGPSPHQTAAPHLSLDLVLWEPPSCMTLGLASEEQRSQRLQAGQPELPSPSPGTPGATLPLIPITWTLLIASSSHLFSLAPKSHSFLVLYQDLSAWGWLLAPSFYPPLPLGASWALSLSFFCFRTLLSSHLPPQKATRPILSPMEFWLCVDISSVLS